MKKGTTIRTGHVIKLGVIDDDGSPNRQEYTVLFGPTPGSNEIAIGEIKNGSTIIYVSLGWAYLYGTRPQGETDWGEAGAHGSDILVQVDSQANRHRFYFAKSSGPNAWVNSKLSPTPNNQIDPWVAPVPFEPTFVEYDDRGILLTQPAKVPAIGDGAGIGKFYSDVIAIVAAGGP